MFNWKGSRKVGLVMVSEFQELIQHCFCALRSKCSYLKKDLCCKKDCRYQVETSYNVLIAGETKYDVPVICCMKVYIYHLMDHGQIFFKGAVAVKMQ